LGVREQLAAEGLALPNEGDEENRDRYEMKQQSSH